MSSRNYVVLIRDPDDEYGEKKAMKEVNIPFVEARSRLILSDSEYYRLRRPVVIGRYSVLPFYKELEDDVKCNGFHLVNTYSQFKYVADMQNWYQDLKEFTPYTWFSMQEYLADTYEGPVVLKGETNSRRDKWLTHMFANNKDEAKEVNGRLLDDGLISQQQIYIRKYEPLVKLIDGVNGMPIPNEWRFFVLYGQVISDGFYWSTYAEDISEKNITIEAPSSEFIKNIVEKIGDKSNFYTIDIAQGQNGLWHVIELNEGQMSGLNSIDRKTFYTKMKKVLDEQV